MAFDKKRYEDRKKKGLCVYCGMKNDRKDKISCSECHKVRQVKNKKINQ